MGLLFLKKIGIDGDPLPTGGNIGMIGREINSNLFYKNQRKEIPMAVSFLPRIDFKTVSACGLEHIDAAGFQHRAHFYFAFFGFWGLTRSPAAAGRSGARGARGGAVAGR